MELEVHHLSYGNEARYLSCDTAYGSELQRLRVMIGRDNDHAAP